MPPRPFRWNAALGRYIDPRGRMVSRIAVRTALDDAIAATGRQMRQVTQQMRDRRITVSAWQSRMKQEIKNVHLYNAAAARGGFAQITPAEYGRLGSIVKKEYGYLDKFARDVRSGAAPMDGRVLPRADMYAEAGRKTYHATDERVQLGLGMTEERNILSLGDTCVGCEVETGLSWVPIGQLRPVGTRDCLSRCRCTINYR